MTPRLLAAAALLAALPAPLPAAAAPPPFPAAAAIRGDVAFLADDLLEGRGIGQRGHEIAARYVAARFAALGLVPAGTDGYFQRITFQERSFASPRETLTLALPSGTVELVNGELLRVAPGTAPGPETISGGLVFAGFGLRDARLGIDDYAGLDVAGKVVVVLSGAPTAINSEIAAHLARTRGLTAAQLGAVGVITVRTLAEAERLPWAKAVRNARAPRRTWVAPDATPDTDASALRFDAAIDDVAAAALFAGAPKSFAQVRAEAATGSPRGFALPGTATLTRATAIGTITSPNVIALLPGSDGALLDQIVLMTAHLDHLGMTAGTGDVIYNGAMDNAAGIATMLEAARELSTGKRRPRRSVMFVATTGEESGLIGAAYFARHPPVRLDRVVAEVNLDMPNLLCDFADIVAYGADRSTLGPMIAGAAKREGLILSPDPQPVEAIFTRSDHYMLVRQGVPSVFLKTGWRDTKGGMSCKDADTGFRRTHYHEPSDDLTQPFDWNVAAKFARLNAAIVRAIADAAQPPRWYAGDYFGESFAPLAAKAVPRQP